MSFLTAVKTFPYFLLRVVCSWGPRPFLAVFSVSFNSGPRYLVYFVEIFLFWLILRCVKLPAFILRVFSAEIIV
jgi:hypothetical protein